MTLDEKLDLFYDSAIKEATAKNIQIIEDYKKSLQQIYDDHKTKTLQNAKVTLQLETEKLASDKNKKLSSEALNIRRATTLKTAELREILFAQVTRNLEDFMKTEDYIPVLAKQILDAKAFAKDDAVTIYINPSDADKKSRLEEETNTELTVSATDFFGGIRAVIHAKNILIDTSFMSKLAEEKDTFKF